MTPTTMNPDTHAYLRYLIGDQTDYNVNTYFTHLTNRVCTTKEDLTIYLEVEANTTIDTVSITNYSITNINFDQIATYIWHHYHAKISV